MAIVLLVAQVLGALTSINALMSTRTSQGTIAWLVALNTVPIVSVPAYWVFGRDRFRGYVTARKNAEEQFGEQAIAIREEFAPFVVEPQERGGGGWVGRHLAEMPFVGANEVELLVDGVETFDSILEGIRRAREYVLVQFYIVHDDEIGTDLADAMVERAAAGVRVWFLYDEIGSSKLPADYLRRLEDAGIRVSSFHSTRGAGNRFQLNFRNHRKIVVVDGREGWVGGHNVGDEYLGRDPEFPNWRDTHMRIAGPSVLELQISFAEDWRWATDETPDVPWRAVPSDDGEAVVLILPTGPADRLESASLMYQQAIHSARERIWIASPYFVPDQAVMSALHLAAMRGVDVRVIVPDVPDQWLVYFSAWAFVGDLLESGVRIYRYQPGFMHQKVFLVDDEIAGVGTANFDNRSFRLNFEVTALVRDEAFMADMVAMFENDFARSNEMSRRDVEEKGFWFRLAARAAFLTAPIQ